MLAGRTPSRAFGLLGALLRHGGLLDGLLTRGDRGRGIVLGGSGAPFGGGDVFGGALFGGGRGSAGFFGCLFGGVDLGEGAGGRGAERFGESGQLSRSPLTCAQQVAAPRTGSP
ncbi:hypothetical protein GCM10022252_63340 [Streptosporangium oxazolinicum]|uniref:Uncharacterized protein n=1 Tax=Streptosporangium oxazolinicum TaxID=909287 RepID=A0ABP8BDN0_9ACTN